MVNIHVQYGAICDTDVIECIIALIDFDLVRRRVELGVALVSSIGGCWR